MLEPFLFLDIFIRCLDKEKLLASYFNKSNIVCQQNKPCFTVLLLPFFKCPHKCDKMKLSKFSLVPQGGLEFKAVTEASAL